MYRGKRSHDNNNNNNNNRLRGHHYRHRRHLLYHLSDRSFHLRGCLLNGRSFYLRGRHLRDRNSICTAAISCVTGVFDPFSAHASFHSLDAEIQAIFEDSFDIPSIFDDSLDTIIAPASLPIPLLA